jgi:hypothetical protein
VHWAQSITVNFTEGTRAFEYNDSTRKEIAFYKRKEFPEGVIPDVIKESSLLTEEQTKEIISYCEASLLKQRNDYLDKVRLIKEEDANGANNFLF